MIQPTLMVAPTGASLNMLAIFDTIQVKNEDKLSQSDRDFCEMIQKSLYATLDQLDACYDYFLKETSKYRDEYTISFKKDGQIEYRDLSRYSRDSHNYNEFCFLPFKPMNDIVIKRSQAIRKFIQDIIDHFNKSYNFSVSAPQVATGSLPVNYRPVYMSYVDTVIGYLDGNSFRQKAEEEIMGRLLSIYPQKGWKKPPVQKAKVITFPNIISYNSMHLEYHHEYQMEYGYNNNLEQLCAAITLFGDGRLNGDMNVIRNFNDNNINMTDWYKLVAIKSIEMKFFKNGRIDVRFESSAIAEECYKKLKLNTL